MLLIVIARALNNINYILHSRNFTMFNILHNYSVNTQLIFNDLLTVCIYLYVLLLLYLFLEFIKNDKTW